MKPLIFTFIEIVLERPKIFHFLMFDNCSIISVGVSTIWESTVIGSVGGSISDWWDLSNGSNSSAGNQWGRLNVWGGHWGSVGDRSSSVLNWGGSVLNWGSSVGDWLRSNSNWSLNDGGLSILLILREKIPFFRLLSIQLSQRISVEERTQFQRHKSHRECTQFELQLGSNRWRSWA